MACPNKQHPDWKKLEAEYGEGKALALFALNGDEIPSLARAKEFLEGPKIPTNGPNSGAINFTAPLFSANSGLTQVRPANETVTSATAEPEAVKEIVSPEREKVMNRQFDRLKALGKTTKLVVEDKDTHIATHYEVDGKKVKYKTDDENVGITTARAQRLANEVRGTIKDILDRFIDKDGHARSDPEARPEILPNDNIYNELEQVIQKRVEVYPAGTKFIYNTNIYSEAWDKASKVDFLALKPNGKADLLAFDIIGHKNYGSIAEGSPARDVKYKDQIKIREFLNQTKGILKTSYDIKDFDKSESIPMYMKLDMKDNSAFVKSINWDGVNSDNNDRKFIDPIPTWDQSAGNKDMDNLVKKLAALFEAKGGERYSESNVNAKNAITNAIRAVQLGKGILPVVSMIDTAARASEHVVLQFDDVRKATVDSLSTDDLATEAAKLNRSSKELDMYGQMYLYYKDFYPDPTDKEKELLGKLEKASARARLALTKLDDVKREFIQDKVAQKYGVEQLLLPEKKVGWYEGNMNSFDKPVTKAQYVFYRMIDNSRNQYRNKTTDHLKELNSIYTDIQEWLKGKSNTDLLDLIKKKDERGVRVNELIEQFRKEYYTTAKEKIDDTNSSNVDVRVKALEWLRANVDKDALKVFADKERARKMKWMQDTFENFTMEQVTDINDEFNVDKPFIYQNYHAIEQFPRRDLWQTTEFNQLEQPSNAPVMALYKYTREINKIAAKIGYIEGDKASRFLPFLHKSLAESIILGGKFSFTDSILDAFTVSKVDVDYGKYDRIANEQVDSLPKYYTSDFGTEVTDASGKTYIDHSNVSDDIMKNLALYTGKVLEYEGKSGLEDQVKMLLWAEKNKESLQTNQFGNVVADSEPMTDNSDNYQMLRDFVQNQFYGQSYVSSKYTDAASRVAINEKFNRMAEKLNKAVGFELIKKQQEERRFSLMKTLQALQQVQQLKVLGLNLGASTYRFLGTNVQGWINSGEYYTAGELFKHDIRHAALQFYKGNAELHIALLKEFWPVDSQMKKEMDRMSLSKITAASASDMLMHMIESAHDYIQYVNFGAMMDNTIVIDGKLYNARKYVMEQTAKERYDTTTSAEARKEAASGVEDKIKALIEEHGLLNKAEMKDGKLIIDGFKRDDPSVAKYKGIIRSVGRKLSGNISSENESRLRMTVLGRQLLMFKNWLPGMLNTRFTGLSHNEGLQDYEWGRVRMMGKIILQNGINSASRLISMYRATEKGVDLMEKLYEQKKADFEKENQRAFDLSKEQFFDLIRKNIAQETKELTAMIALSGVLAGVVSLAHQHDEKEKGYWAFTQRVLDRSYEELNLYYNPVSMNNIANGSMFPTLGLLIDMTRFLNSVKDIGLAEVEGDDKKIKSTHPTKYLMKNIPLFAQVPNYIAIIAPDLAKEMGITVNAKKVNH